MNLQIVVKWRVFMANFRETNQVSDGKKISGSKAFLCLLFVVWTGILVWSGLKQYYSSEKIEKKVASLLLEHGGSKMEEFEKIEPSGIASYLARQTLSQTGVLSYLLEHQGKLPKREEKDIVKIAALFSGKNADTAHWCAAAGKKSMEYELFAKSDQTIPDLLAQEKSGKKGQKETVVASDTKEEQEEKELDTLDETLAVPVQNILLFRNGSPDITRQNKESDSKKNISNALLCDSRDKLEANLETINELKNSYSRSYLLRKFYIADSSTSVDNHVFQVKKLVEMDLTLKKESKPQILIFHTHGASEAFIDSKAGRKEDSIIGVGNVLAEILSEEYGYQVLHDKTEYDRINGSIDRNKAYNNAYNGLQKTLKKYPSIQIIIDLHRDGVGNKVQRTTRIAGKRTAQVMFFNGLSRNSSGNIAYLHNDNLQGNLAFSLQLKMECMKRFEDFARPVYLKGYRYNMHLRKRYTLIELGNENNTVQEAKNAMAPLAMALDAVLTGK